MSAKTHTAISNRAKAKQSLDRKTVFKSVLDSPFHVRWPAVPLNVQNSILSRVIAMLDGVAEHHLNRDQSNRKRKRANAQNTAGTGERPTKQRRSVPRTSADVGPIQNKEAFVSNPKTEGATAQGASKDRIPITAGVPSVLSFLTIGINAVTKRLEAQARAARQTTTTLGAEIAAATPRSPRSIRLILACLADIDPPILIGHLPELVAAYNSANRGHAQAIEKSLEHVKLVPLPKGAEFTLSEAVGLRRASVLAIDADCPGLSMMDDLINQVPVLAASWMTPQLSVTSEEALIPTHIKQTRTSVPKDMKAAKQQRAEGKAVAKGRRKQRQEQPSKPKRVQITASP